jgi:enoyl-CoA hydratase/carnithine racemase
MEDRAHNQSPYLLSRLSGHVLWLTLNRPESRNPLSRSMIAALQKAIEGADSDPEVRVVVIEGSGPVFCAGHDLKEMGNAGGEEKDRDAHQREILNECAELMLAIVHAAKPVIASVSGIATAAGCQLVATCDLAIASEESKFALPGVNIGAFCTTPLVGVGRKLSRKHAMELALTGDFFPAKDAMRFGLVNRVVPAEDLIEATEALAHKIASKSNLAIQTGKKAFYQQIDMPIEEAYAFATEKMIESTKTADAKEGTLAFFENRKPKWQDM